MNDIRTCLCNPPLPAKELESGAAAKNPGRHFYACSMPQECQCSYFSWADVPESQEMIDKRGRAIRGEKFPKKTRAPVSANGATDEVVLQKLAMVHESLTGLQLDMARLISDMAYLRSSMDHPAKRQFVDRQ